jgi:hypothetical protein
VSGGNDVIAPPADPPREVAAIAGANAPSSLTHRQGQGITVILTLLVLFLFLLGTFHVVGMIKARTEQTRWEYKLESPYDWNFDTRMRELGNDGWELVSARRATSSGSSLAQYEMIFKRRMK